MGKVLGIIAEYNPFHNGHLYHLEESKKISGATYTVAIMSGNFTERGNCAVIDKWSRTKMALKNGIGVVIELPLLYSISSAENFAEGAIKILDSLKVVDYLSFGSESSNIEPLDKIADVLYKEPKEYKGILSHELSKGLSFPKARENALMMYLNDIQKFSNVLSSPNNILGIEYLKAMKKLNCSFTPICIPRVGSGYNDFSFSGNIASATAIRDILRNNSFDILSELLPDDSYSILMENVKVGHVVSDISIFEKQIIYNLRKMDITEIANLADVSEGLEYAIKKAANSCNSIVEFLNIIKSKRYTATRICRILLYSLLGITKKDIALSRKVYPYIRVLGFNERGKYLISEAYKANPKLEIVTSVKKFLDNCTNRNLRNMIEKDIWATNVYSLGFEYDALNNLDFTQKIVVV